MQRTGAFLKNLRQEKGFTIEEVTRGTNMSPSVVRALEDGRLDTIDPVYLKGFLKLYCRFLNVKWEDFIKDYPVVPVGKEGQKISQVKKQRHQQKKDFLITSFISENKKIILKLLYVIAIAFLLVLLFKGCSFLIKKIPKGAPKQSNKAAVLEEPQKKKQDLQDKAIKKDLVPKSIKVGILLKEDSYVKVIVDGRPIYRGVLRKGKQEIWTAKEKVELSVGNAGGIELEFDGKRYSPLGKRGQAIKQILIDHTGLRIL